MKKTHTFLDHARQLACLALASSAVGLVRELLVARKLGATSGTDAYLTGLAIPTMLYAFLLGSGLSVSVIPRLASILKQTPKRGSRNFAQFLSAATAFGVTGSVLVFLFAPSLVRVFAPGLTGSPVCVEYTRMLSSMFFLMVATYSLSAFLSASGRPAASGWIALSQNLIVVLALLASPAGMGMPVLVYATLAGATLALLVQARLARNAGFQETWVSPWRDGEGMKLVYALIPFVLVLGIGGDSGTTQLDVFLVRYFGSHLRAGSITLLTLAHKLAGLPANLIGSAIGIAVLPSASLSIGNGNREEAGRKLIAAVSYAMALACPIFVLYLDTSVEIGKIVFSRTALNAAQIGEIGNILRNYSGEILGLTLVYILCNFLGALKKTRALITCGVGVLAMNALAMRELSEWYGAPGIALTMSIGSLVYSCGLGCVVLKALDSSVTRVIVRRMACFGAGALLMHGVLRGMSGLDMFRQMSWAGQALLPAAAAVCVYVMALIPFRSRMLEAH